MPLTDHTDIYAALHEDGFNRFLEHVRLQRPSLFNYATEAIAENPDLLCSAIRSHPIVKIRNNPSVTIVDPLPIPGTDYGLNFAAQLTACKIDFHPGNAIRLPRELNPPLQPQRLALFFRVCGGLGCPPRDLVEQIIPPPDNPDQKQRENDDDEDIIPIPARKLICFCLDAFAVGGVRIREYWGKPWLEPYLDGFEIVDIKPAGLENSLECYIELVVRLSVLPQLRYLLEIAPLEIIKEEVHLELSAEPTSEALPNNPAIEDDQLKAFIHAEVV